MGVFDSQARQQPYGSDDNHVADQYYPVNRCNLHAP